jgi:glycosyltransferase involved in cell wall biosynthesis
MRAPLLHYGGSVTVANYSVVAWVPRRVIKTRKQEALAFATEHQTIVRAIIRSNHDSSEPSPCEARSWNMTSSTLAAVHDDSASRSPSSERDDCMGSSLRVGIDIHSIGSQKGGNETYYRELVRGLATVPCNHEFILYYTNPVTTQLCNLNGRFSRQAVHPSPRWLRIPVGFPWRMRKDKLDVFHAQYIVPPFPSCKTVVSIFDLAHERYPEFFHTFEGRALRALVRGSAKRADHVVTVSYFSAGDLVEIYGVKPDNITVIYLAASDDFRPMDQEVCRGYVRNKYGLASPYILYAGRLQARKNLVRLVEAYSRLHRKGIEENLVLVGKQDWRADEILDCVRKNGLESRVSFLGYVPGEDLPYLYNAAKLFVYPSIFEGFGLPVVESMACGTPTITSQGSSLEEIAGDGALLVDPLSASSIGDAMERALEDPTLLRSLSERGLARSKQFSYRTAASKTLAIYERV